MFKYRFLFALWLGILGLSMVGVQAWAAKMDEIAPLQTENNRLWGVVSDASGNPLAGVSPTVSGATAVITPSNAVGFYYIQVPTTTLTYTVAWNVPGYGPLPESLIDNTIPHNHAINVILPPADNLVQNAHFEDGFNGWQIGGNISPTINTVASHTGQQGVFLGSQTNAQILHSLDTTRTPAMLVDNAQTTHILVDSGNGGLLYHQRTPDGNWQTPIVIPGIPTSVNSIQMAVDTTGKIHTTVLMSDLSVYYLQRTSDGVWSVPELVIPPVNGSLGRIDMATTANGIVHLVWLSGGRIWYTHRDLNGTWSTGEEMPMPNGYVKAEYQKMVLDSYGNAYIFGSYKNSDTNSSSAVYIHYRSYIGSWLPPELVIAPQLGGLPFDVVMGGNDVLHVMWIQGSIYPLVFPHAILYRQLSGGIWYPPEIITTNLNQDLFTFTAGADGRVYAIYPDGEQTDYVERGVSGVWSNPIGIDTDEPHGHYGPLAITIEPDDTLSVSWYKEILTNPGTFPRIYYRQKSATGQWGETLKFPDLPYPFVIYAYTMGLVQGEPVFLLLKADRNSYGYYFSSFEVSPTSINQTLSQTITIPLTMTDPALFFMYQLGYVDEANGIEATVWVDNGHEATAVWSHATSTYNNWLHASADLTPWAGQTITLTLRVHEVIDELRPYFLLDEVTLGSVLPDLAVNMGETAVMPSETAVYHLEYGNRGGAPVPTSTLTFTLPAEVAFLSASITPTTVLSDSVLVWELGNLPGKTWQTLTVSGTVTATAVFGDIYSHTLTITTPSTESQTINNALTNHTVIGYRQFLPFMKP